MCQQSTASLRAVATTAICIPRRARTRSKNARSGPAFLTATQAASTSIPRACARPCLVIGPCAAGWPPDCLTRGLSPRYRTSLVGEPKRAKSPPAAVIASATVTSTPGIVISRRVAGQPSAIPRQLGVDPAQLVAVEVQLAQQRREGAALVGRQLLLGQPGPARAPEQVGGRAARHEVAMQDRLHLVLQARALAHQVRAARDLPAPRLRLLVG